MALAAEAAAGSAVRHGYRLPIGIIYFIGAGSFEQETPPLQPHRIAINSLMCLMPICHQHLSEIPRNLFMKIKHLSSAIEQVEQGNNRRSPAAP